MKTNSIYPEKKKSREYIVITPSRNEERNLPNLVHSLTAQTIRPALWVVVDDGSTDKTEEIVEEAEKQYGWMKGIHLKRNEGYMGTHIAYVCNQGFEFAKNYCDQNGISYEYIALVDADTVLEGEYFEKLIEEFEKDEKLGIASGNNAHADIVTILDTLKLEKPDITVADPEFWQLWNSPFVKIVQDSREDLPLGSARMWRRACFDETGGYLPVPLPDAVSNAKAKMKGWRTRRFRNIKLIERYGLKKQGLWKGYKEKGESLYLFGQPLSFAILKAINRSLEKPYYAGIAFLYGYIKSLVLRKERIADEEIRKYFHSIHHSYYLMKIKRYRENNR